MIKFKWVVRILRETDQEGTEASQALNHCKVCLHWSQNLLILLRKLQLLTNVFSKHQHLFRRRKVTLTIFMNFNKFLVRVDLEKFILHETKKTGLKGPSN